LQAHVPPEDSAALLRVLIVDDNVAAAQTTGWMIEMPDLDYRLATTVMEALRTAEDYRPHVALIDIVLPGMSGFDLCRNMRRLTGLEDTVFIAQTGWTGADHRRLATEAGFHDYLLKPVPLETLQAMLNDVRAANRMRCPKA